MLLDIDIRNDFFRYDTKSKSSKSTMRLQRVRHDWVTNCHALPRGGLPRWLRRSRVRLPIQDTWVRSLGQEDPLKKWMATHSRILRTPWTEEPDGQYSPWGCKELDTTNTSNRNPKTCRMVTCEVQRTGIPHIYNHYLWTPEFHS